MNRRDDFPQPVKQALADRAGYHCSFPNCPLVTIGPSDESSEATSSTGMACHIVAASGGPGARRVIPSWTKEQRCSIDNGIWMCYTHGKLIDTDEQRFSISMLRTWREIAETRARYRQELGKEIGAQHAQLLNIGFAKETITVTKLGNENVVIGSSLQDSCVPIIWGDGLADAVRDVLIEITRNAFIHGGATRCFIKVDVNNITHSDDGSDFNYFSLTTREIGRGGRHAARGLISSYGEKLLLGSKRIRVGNEQLNRHMFALASFDDLHVVEPCRVDVSHNDLNDLRKGVIPNGLIEPDMAPCHIIYLVLPQFPSPSDACLLAESLPEEEIKKKQLVFVGANVSSLVAQQLREFFPGSRVLNLPTEE